MNPCWKTGQFTTANGGLKMDGYMEKILVIIQVW